MLNNEMKTVQAVSFTEGLDDFGRKRQKGETTKSIDMYIKVYTQTNVSDVRYLDAEYVGLTRNDLSGVEQIIDGSETYNILHIVPSRRYTTVFLKKV